MRHTSRTVRLSGPRHRPWKVTRLSESSPACPHASWARHGEPLPPSVRGVVESFFGADFGTVRIHVAAEVSALGLRAFAFGEDLYFAPGHYEPATREGRRLLGHELTHVLQQRAGCMGMAGPVSDELVVLEAPELEAEAEVMGALLALGLHPPVELLPRDGLPAARRGFIQPAWWYNLELGEIKWVPNPKELEQRGDYRDRVLQELQETYKKGFQVSQRPLLVHEVTEENGWNKYVIQEALEAQQEQLREEEEKKTRTRKDILAWWTNHVLKSFSNKGVLTLDLALEIARIEGNLGVRNPAWTGPNSSNDPLLTHSEMQGISYLARAILTAYPDHNIISVGSSPTLITEYLDLLGARVHVVRLPLSSVPEEKFANVSQRQRRNVLAYLEKALSDNNLTVKKLAERKILIVDEVITGSGIATTKLYLELLLAKKGVMQQVVMLSLTEPDEQLLRTTQAKCTHLDIMDIRYFRPGSLSIEAREVQNGITQCVYKNSLALRMFDRSRYDYQNIKAGTVTQIVPLYAQACRIAMRVEAILRRLHEPKFSKARKVEVTVLQYER